MVDGVVKLYGDEVHIYAKSDLYFSVTRKWTCPEVFTESQKPEYRMGHTATYDPKLRCIYVYGGSKNQRWFHDVHMLDLEEWKWTLLKV